MIDSKLLQLGFFPIYLQLENIWNLGQVTQKPPAPNGHSFILCSVEPIQDTWKEDNGFSI